MQSVVQFAISSLIANLNSLTNFFSQFGSFCPYYPCLCCNNFFNAIGTELAKMPNTFNNNAEFFCMDISSIRFLPDGRHDFANSPWNNIRDKSGILIIFDRNVGQILRVSASTILYDYGQRFETDNTHTLLEGVDISNCSVFFLCLTTTLGNAPSNKTLNVLRNALIAVLKPTHNK